MDFTFENPLWTFSQKDNSSWAGNIYRKIEKMRANKIVQVPSKYVDMFSEHVRMFLDDVDELLDPASNRDKGTDFVKSIDNDSKTVPCTESSEGFDENMLNESTISAIEEPVISSVEDTTLVTPHDVAQDTLSNGHEKEQIATQVTDSSCTGVDGNYRKITDEVTSSAGTASALSANEVLPSETHKGVVLEEGFMLSGNSTPVEICSTSTSWDMTSLVRSLGNEQEHKFKPNESEADVQLPEFAASAIEEPVISSMEDTKLVTPLDIAQDTLNNEHEKEQIPTEATDSSGTGVDGNYRKITDEVASSGSITSAVSANEVLPSESHKSVVLEEGFMLSGNSTPAEICGTSTSWDMTSLVRSLGNEREQKFEPNGSEADVRLPESAVSDISDVTGGEDMFNSTDRADMSTGFGEFEDVDLQDSWDDDDEDYELALVSYQEFKNRSCKRKLRAAIISKLRLSKDYGQVAYWHHDTNKGMQDGRGITESSVLKASSIHDSSEPDWEFL